MSGITNIPSNASERPTGIWSNGKGAIAFWVGPNLVVWARYAFWARGHLSSDRNYFLWKTQMLCLMKSHNMGGIVDDSLVNPKTSSQEIMDQYDSLLVGWIFGSASENVLDAVVNLASAKDVWDQLKSFYDTTVSHQQGISNIN
ncbi:hypothetical protein Tco_0124214 [Tanacetum coccineum]